MSWAPTYASSMDLAGYLRVDDGVDEDEMVLALAAASRAVDSTCRRQFGQASGSRVYTARPESGRWVVDTDDLVSVSAVATDTDLDGGFATVVTGMVPGPVNAPADGHPYTRLTSRAEISLALDAVRVTGVFGWESVPDVVCQATLVQASRFMARRDSPFGVAGSPETGSELRLLSRVDPDVAVMLQPYTRRWWAV